MRHARFPAGALRRLAASLLRRQPDRDEARMPAWLARIPDRPDRLHALRTCVEGPGSRRMRRVAVTREEFEQTLRCRCMPAEFEPAES